jgi:SAM-dependent methyltransferase
MGILVVAEQSSSSATWCCNGTRKAQTWRRHTCLLALTLVAVVVVPNCRVNAWTTSGTTTWYHRNAAAARLLRVNTPSKTRRSLQQPLNLAVSAAAKGDGTTSSASSSSKTIYSMPALYDLAFGYRDFELEVDFLLARHNELTGQKRPVHRILELAAGPARHSITALLLMSDDDDPNINNNNSSSMIESVYCIDSSPEMATYAQQVADEVLEVDMRPHFHYQVADMRNFTIPASAQALPVVVDTAWILLGSLQHLTTNADVIQCLQSVHTALHQDGTVFIELPHPRETFSMVECTRNGWKVPLELAYDDDENEEDDGDEESEPSGGALSIIWGDEGDEFDPVTQVRQFTIQMELTGAVPDDMDGMQSVREVVPLRIFTAQEIDALARCAGFQVVAMYGALEEGVSVDDEDASFRLICALRKNNS